MNRKYYVYELLNPLKDNIPFYVGKSYRDSNTYHRFYEHILEAKNYKTESSKHKNFHKIHTINSILSANKEVGFNVVFEADDELIVLDFEKSLIEKYGRRINNTGILTNIGVGGTGVCFTKKPDSWILERKSIVGDKHWNFGRPASDETKQKMSKSRTARIKKGDIQVGPKTTEGKEKLRNLMKNKFSKPVYAISLDGKILQEYSSAQEAIKTMSPYKHVPEFYRYIDGNFNHRPIFNLYWRYVDLYSADEDFMSLFTSIIKYNGKSKVKQLSENGDILMIWDSRKDIPDHWSTKFSIIMMDRSIKSKKPYKGFYWEYC